MMNGQASQMLMQDPNAQQAGLNFGLLSPIAPKQGVVANLPQAKAQNDTSSLLSGLGKLASGIKSAVTPQQSTGTPTTNDALINSYIGNEIGTTGQSNTNESVLQQTGQNVTNASTLSPLIAQFESKQYSPNMNGLNPTLVKGATGLMLELRQEGFQPVIAEANRTKEQQAEKVRQGYSQTMNSNHIGGNAMDIVDSRYGWDDKNHPQEIAHFADAMNRLAPKYGLFSGTNWKSFGPHGDFAHVQTMKNSQQMQQSLVNQQQDQAAPSQQSNGAPQQPQQQSSNQQQGASVNPQQLQQQFNNHSIPRGVRNNNPGNLEIGSFTQSQPGFTKGADPRFASFSTPEQGLGALSNLMTSKYNGQSLNQIISHYAPPGENDTQGYINTLSRSTGLDPNKPVDMSNTKVRQKVMQGIIQIENGSDPYTSQQYDAAVQSQQASNNNQQGV